jgi:hypothetical protein
LITKPALTPSGFTKPRPQTTFFIMRVKVSAGRGRKNTVSLEEKYSISPIYFFYHHLLYEALRNPRGQQMTGKLILERRKKACGYQL